MQEHAPDLWTLARPHRMLGLELGTRMTIVRLPAGALWVHSPVALDGATRAEVDALGAVGHVVCPNLYHHVYAKQWAEAYPGATVHAPAGLRKKRRDLRIDEELSEEPDPRWGDALVPIHIDGSMLDETVFVHPASRTVVSADLMENFGSSEHWPTKLYLKVSGIEHRVGLGRLLHLLFRDHRATRESLDRLLEHDFDRAIVAHGAIVEHGAKEAIRRTYEFLRA